MLLKPVPSLVFASVALLGCTPPESISVERAMAQCTQKARAAIKPEISIGVGIGTGGKVSGGVGIGISGDLLAGRDPDDVYETCVVARSGQQPTQPLKL